MGDRPKTPDRRKVTRGNLTIHCTGFGLSFQFDLGEEVDFLTHHTYFSTLPTRHTSPPISVTDRYKMMMACDHFTQPASPG